MIKKFTLLLWLCLPLLSISQNSTRVYDYDAAGNRTSRVIINLPPLPMSPPAPPEDPILTEIESEDEEDLATLISLTFSDSKETTPTDNAEYFVEKVGQVGMKIYPNPTPSLWKGCPQGLIF